MQNSNVSMTRDQYFEMCEMLGTEPVESEIPVEFDDMPLEVQTSLLIYRILRDDWEGMSGTYMGKNINGIFDIFTAYEIDNRDKKFYLELIHIIDSIRSKEINSKNQSNTKPAS